MLNATYGENKRCKTTTIFKKPKIKKSDSSEKSYNRIRKRVLDKCKITEQNLSLTNDK